MYIDLWKTDIFGKLNYWSAFKINSQLLNEYVDDQLKKGFEKSLTHFNNYDCKCLMWFKWGKEAFKFSFNCT